MIRTDLEAIKAALEGALVYMNAVPVPPDTSLAVVIALTKRETNVRSVLALVQQELDEPAECEGAKQAGAEAMRADCAEFVNDHAQRSDSPTTLADRIRALPLPLPSGGRT